ncbi:MAG: Ig-like domain-containing protein [Anaerolineales bacterium]
MFKKLFYLTALSALLVGLLGAGTAGVSAQGESGFRALSGEAAGAFNLPGDVELVTSFDLPAYGLTYERYQQVYGQADALVLGGQITLYSRGDAVVSVIGAHYPAISASNQINLTAAQARQRAVNDVGQAGERIVDLMINPDSGRYFYRVETQRADERWFHWIDAGDGAILNKIDALMHECGVDETGCGFGVQWSEDTTDVKDMTGLTTFDGSEYLLQSSDERQETHDQGSTNRPFLGPIATDSDDAWILEGNESPAQQALVDAHYYANVTDDYFLDVHGYDWVAEAIAAGANDRMEVHAHYSVDYNNAFWNGEYIALGDGDQETFEELTALDVVGHELTHGTTDFTSDLIYEDEPGALNESFSDMMGTAMEYWAEAEGREPATTLEPDWWIGEDFDLRDDEVPGFRNMEDPEEETWSNGAYPDHYTELYTGSDDNGGVHINSSIPNHAFYLLAEGGLNASCASKSDHNSEHCDDSEDTQDNDLNVTAIGLADAEAIMFLGFTALNSSAQMCDARLGTEAVAASLFEEGSQQETSTSEAWIAVGLTDQACGLEDTDSPPSVTVTNPSDGDTVSGTVTITADATDDDAVTQVEFFVDGGSISVDSEGSDGWSASWDTTDYSDGSHTVSATATDTAGQTATDSVSVTVDNVDDPPTVTITNPEDGSTVSGTVEVTADASDDDAVTQVEFFVDDGSIGTDSDGSDGWTVNWDTTAYADGSHTVEAVATDTAGQTASDSVSVTVDNTADGISLSATGYKERGLQKADLEWSGATSTDVDVYRDGALIATTENDGFYTDNIDQRGSGSYTYQVCEVGTSTCSNEATVDF